MHSVNLIDFAPELSFCLSLHSDFHVYMCINIFLSHSEFQSTFLSCLTEENHSGHFQVTSQKELKPCTDYFMISEIKPLVRQQSLC